MNDAIEQAIKWLEACKPSISAMGREYQRRRFYACLDDIHKLETFVDLKPNEAIQSYWHPVLTGWRERLGAVSTALFATSLADVIAQAHGQEPRGKR